MKPISLQTLTNFAEGNLRRGDGSRLVTGVSTDSRKVSVDDIFVALIGEKFDAHQFIPEVVAAGVAAIMVSSVRDDWNLPPDCAVIEVADTLKGLQNMARGYRAWHQPLIIGLTGSNGKTSTKDLTSLIMSRRYQTRATVGNLNNHIGVPLTLLRLAEGDECGVVEMGMNHPGEIRELVDIALPDAAIVTNIGMAHIEYMGSQDAIGWEKGSLPANVHSEGIVVLNSNDSYTQRIARHCQGTVLTAGVNTGDVFAYDLQPGPGGTSFSLNFSGEKVQTFLPVLGSHMVGNAALAACMGWAHGITPDEIAEAISQAKLTGGRMEVKTVNGILFIDDSYNANPDSMCAGLSALAGLAGQGCKIAVLGRMGELGSIAAFEHKRVGEFAASLGLTAIYSVGDEGGMITDAARAAGHSESRNFASHQACAQHLREFLQEGDAVFLKGSRSAGMEKVLHHFQAP